MCQPAATPSLPQEQSRIQRPAPTAKTKELRQTGQGHFSGPPLRAKFAELGPAGVGEAKARVLSGTHLKGRRDVLPP